MFYTLRLTARFGVHILLDEIGTCRSRSRSSSTMRSRRGAGEMFAEEVERLAGPADAPADRLEHGGDPFRRDAAESVIGA
jgi:hypothetical protein